MTWARVGTIALGPLLLIAVWQVAAISQLFPSTLLPTPLDTANALIHLVASGSVWPDFGNTVYRMAVGYFFATAIGISIGLAMGSFMMVRDLLSLPVDFFRSTPVTTLYPVFVLFFGISHLSKIAMIFTSSVFVIALHSAYGVMQANPNRRNMAILYGATRWQVLRWIVFYDALPQTLVGLRIAVSYSLIVAILCEMFMGSQYGLGQRVIDAYTAFATDQLFAFIVLIGVFGYVLNRLFVLAERRLVPWVYA